MLVTKYRPVAALTLLEDNPRQIQDADFRKLCASITAHPDYFEARPCILSDRTGSLVIIAGNMRYRAATHLGLKEIPTVLMPALTEEREREIVIRDNVSNGGWDWDALSSGDWPDAATLNDWGVNVPAEWGVVELPVAEEREPDFTLPSEPITVPGDLYELNGHRLHCGDSTSSDAIAKTLNGKLIDLVFTSPPYNQGNGGYKIDYHGTTKALYKHKGDKRTKNEYYDFLLAVLQTIYINCTDDCPVLWNVAYNANARDDYGQIIFSDEHGFTVKETIIWDKGHGFPSATKGILSRRAELVFLLSKGEKYYTNQGQFEPWFNFWDISARANGGAQTENHGAAFPVTLPLEGITKFSKEKAIVYEPFLGTGTTLIASEQIGRICYAQELDAVYTDVAVRRWLRYMADNNRPATVKRNGIELTKQELAAFST